MNNRPILEIDNLKVSYRVFEGKLKVVEDLNIILNEGEMVGLVGEAGCGKTTILKTILRILPNAGIIENGEINYNNKNILKMNKKEIRNFRTKGAGMIFQDPSSALNPVFKIGYQLKAGLKDTIENNSSRKVLLEERITKALKDVSLAEPDRIKNSYPFQLSGGMKQRVCIAASLASDKKILLADEPGTSLDVTIQDQILRLILGLAKEKNLSVILVSHSLGVIRKMTDRVYVMYAGNIVEHGKTEEIFKDPRHPYTNALMKCIPKITGENLSSGIPGRIPEYLNPPKGCRFSPRCEYKIDDCDNEKPKFTKVGNNHYVSCFVKGGEHYD